MTTITILIALQLIQVILFVIAIRIGAAWVKIEPRNWGRCAVAGVGISVVGIGVALLSLLNPLLNHPMATVPQQLFAIVLGLVVQTVAMIFVLSKVFKISLARAGKLWLPVLGVWMLMVAFAFGVMRPFMIEAYTVPTMSMAPTLRGPWVKGVCPECRGETVVSVRPGGYESMGDTYVCTACYAADRITSKGKPSAIPEPSDRFVVNKLRAPTRFDVVVFRPPDDPETVYVKRLVGLPGETIQLTNRQLLINGQPVAPPPQAERIRFGELLGSTKADYAIREPLQLGTDEYFMIGDNQPFAADSRFMGPVPVANLIGVVEVIYWPVTRMQLLP